MNCTLCEHSDVDCFATCYDGTKPAPKDQIKEQPQKKEEDEDGFFDGWLWDVLLLGAKAAI